MKTSKKRKKNSSPFSGVFGSFRQKKHWSGIVLILGLAGCSLLGGSSAERAAESFQAGTKALSSGKYKEAVSHFRDVSPESPMYPQAVRMIQKVPLQKGIAAYEKEQYRRAVAEFSKVPRQSPDYPEAQRYRKTAEYELAHKQFLAASGEKRLTLIPEMVKLASESGEAKPLLESLDVIGQGIAQATSTEQTRDLLTLLENMVATHKEPAVLEKALQNLLTDFERLYKQPEVRSQVFQLIGNLKLGLMIDG